MAKYRKKPIIVEAWKWPQEHEMIGAEIHFIDSDIDWVCSDCGHRAHTHGNCRTLEGYHIVCPGDYVVKGIRCDYYPCKADMFEEIHEKIEESEIEKEC